MGEGQRFKGPRVRVVSENAQEFQGTTYYRCGKYFSDSASDGIRRLHRAVWFTYHGTIPEGFDVHHIDGDRDNNQIENLLCLPRGIHLRDHGLAQSVRMADVGRAYQHLTKAWHSSPEGKEWHRLHYLAMADVLRARYEAVCSCCGKSFMAAESVKNLSVRYCSKACKAHARRQSGIDNVDRWCIQCGAKFSANRYSSRKKCELCFPSRRSGRLLPDRS